MRTNARLHATFAAVMALVSSANVKADITITADNLPTGAFTSTTQHGFTLEYMRGNPGLVVTVGSEQGWAGGGPVNGLGTVYELFQTDNNPFSLISFQGANLDGGTPGHVLPIADNAQFQNYQAFVPTTTTLTTFTPTGFTDVTAIYFSVINYTDNSNLVADNFVIGTAVVPETSSFILGGLGALIIACSAWARQRAWACQTPASAASGSRASIRA
jgi:hypothetical protein